ncbi:helitron_like_N domain-containing protein [Trichonephila clavipes]|nr:helitron_like_N domain-containing protein [Trichonephila clavipes]
MDFYAYYMMLREHDFNLRLRTRQLFHQFLVDMYIKVESERLRYIALSQKKLRAENYIHLQDAISADDNIRPNDIGKMDFLPSTFVNSPRYLQEYTQDAFIYVRTYGRPGIFVNLTCNPSWQDVTQERMCDDFGKQSHTSRRDNRDNFNNEIARELAYDFIALQHQVAELVPQFLPEQNHVSHQVLRKIDFGNGGPFFLDTPGGTGKTFLLYLLLMSVRKDKK